jgi:cytochrome d ubiquinol oxidase subunit I
MDALILARIQFAANISFHILFPTITIALGWVLLFFKLRFNRTRDERLDGRLPLLGEGLRPVLRAGRRLRHHHELPVRHQLAGLHGARRQHRGPLLAYEVLTAFFLEATFLGIMLFGFPACRRLCHPGASWSPRHHTSRLLDPGAEQLDAHAGGFEMRDGVAHATIGGDRLQPSMPTAWRTC